VPHVFHRLPAFFDFPPRRREFSKARLDVLPVALVEAAGLRDNDVNRVKRAKVNSANGLDPPRTREIVLREKLAEDRTVRVEAILTS